MGKAFMSAGEHKHTDLNTCKHIKKAFPHGRGACRRQCRIFTSSVRLAPATCLALLRSASSLSSNYVYHLLDSVIRHAFDSLYPPPAALISAPRGEGSESVLRVGISKQSRPAPESSAPEACGTVHICDLGNSSHAKDAQESKRSAARLAAAHCSERTQ